MTETPKHSRRKPFVVPELILFDQMDRIVMQSSPPQRPSSTVGGRGTARTRNPGDWF
jgi:hypothetical protein